MKKPFMPCTVNELIKKLEFIRDVLNGGDLEIQPVGSGISEDVKVYGASANLFGDNPHAYVVISDEHKKTFPEFVGIFHDGDLYQL